MKPKTNLYTFQSNIRPPFLTNQNNVVTTAKITELETSLLDFGIISLEDRSGDSTGSDPFTLALKSLLYIVHNPEYKFGQSEDEAIEIYINCTGGPVFDALALYDQIFHVRKHHKLFVRTIVQGCAMSGAALIAQAGNERVITDNSFMMIHGVQSGFGGTLREIEIEAEALAMMQDKLVSILAKRMKITKKKLSDQMKREDIYYTAQQALDAHLVDEVWKS